MNGEDNRKEEQQDGEMDEREMANWWMEKLRNDRITYGKMEDRRMSEQENDEMV